MCSVSWICGYGRGGEHLIIVNSASWISGYGIGAVSILLLCILPAGFLAMAGNTASWISGYGRGGEHLIIVCSASWISGYGREHCQLDFWLWQRTLPAGFLAMVGVVSILLLCVLPAGFLAMAGNTASWISGYGRGGEHVIIIVCSASWISGYMAGVVSILHWSKSQISWCMGCVGLVWEMPDVLKFPYP